MAVQMAVAKLSRPRPARTPCGRVVVVATPAVRREIIHVQRRLLYRVCSELATEVVMLHVVVC